MSSFTRKIGKLGDKVLLHLDVMYGVMNDVSNDDYNLKYLNSFELEFVYFQVVRFIILSCCYLMIPGI